MILPESFHTPVLLPELIRGLRIVKGRKYIDATLGGGGYTEAILKLGGRVLGIDADEEAISYVRQKYQIDKELILEQGNFRDIKKIAEKNGFEQVDGVIFDLGMSSYQLGYSGRGFSFIGDEPLDMRMDQNQVLTAGEIINSYPKEVLYEIFTNFAEELHSRAITQTILFARSIRKITSSGQLTDIIKGALRKEGINNRNIQYRSIARIFQALRITVNDELNNLKTGLNGAYGLLSPGGRIAVLSYHSLEDRIVKFIFRGFERSGNFNLISKVPLTASMVEIKTNPRAKAAKLRIGQKV